MAEIKIKGDVSGSTTIKAPDSGSDEIIELSTVLDGKAPLDSPTFTGTPALPDGTTLAGSLLTSGKIRQIVRATDSSNRSTTSTSFTDVTGVTVTITPTKSTSAILIIASFDMDNSANNAYFYAQISDSSNNAISGAESAEFGASSGGGTSGHLQLVAYATPATTSATTYKMRFRSSTGGNTARVRGATNTTQIYAIEVSA